ncbi:MAG: flavodoxin [Candidatus Azobacteroides sp.]|nr:flavodoxin [Candidatus Azobacteroides sp.]
MKKVIIVYGSSTDNTKRVAEQIAKELSGEEVTVMDVSGLKTGTLDNYTNIILGTSTWGLGDLQDDWDGQLPVLSNSRLEGKTIAFFGLGDSSSYPDTFVDGMGILYEAVRDKGATLVGEFPTDGYEYDDSKAVVDGKFVGVALDEDNEDEKTEGRLKEWLSLITPAFQ